MSTSGSPVEALKSTVKNAMALSREKRWDEFFTVYGELFASEEFKQNRPEDQRQALKLMVMTKGLPPADTQAAVSAYQAAWYVLNTLVNATRDPRDYELLGMTHLRLSDEDGARKVYQAGLDLARAADDADMCGTFLKHLSYL